MRLLSGRDVATAAILGAFYATLTVALAPLSYGPIQLRLSEAIKPLIVWIGPPAIYGLAAGNVVANLFSPLGLIDILVNPLGDLLGGYIFWWLRRWPYVGALVYAWWGGAWVATTLAIALGAPWLPSFVSVGLAETIVVMGGIPICRHLVRTLAQRGISLHQGGQQAEV
jgi:uncharacterized membrane protein